MTSIDSILRDARSLSPADRLQLARRLFEEANTELQADEDATGRRGLAAWTQSTRDEDWSAFYPPELQSRKAS